MLKNQMEDMGNFLFRWRSFIPVALIPLSILALFNSSLYFEDEGIREIFWHTLCFTISFLGVFIRAYVVGYSAPNTSGRNTKKQVADSVNKTGAYSTVRHPLYVANFLMLFGLVLLTQSAWFALLFIFCYIVYYERIMLAEEKFMLGKFGDEYSSWASSVPAFIPSFKNFKKPENKFSWKKVLRKEYPGILWLAVNATLIEILTEYLHHKEFVLYTDWKIFLISSVVLALSLRILKKHTNLLKG